MHGTQIAKNSKGGRKNDDARKNDLVHDRPVRYVWTQGHCKVVRRQRWLPSTQSLAMFGPRGAFVMRRRTGTRYVPITISLQPEMVNDIEAELSRKQSRSEWIASAIEAKLNGEGSPADFPSAQLLAVVLNRGHITENMFEMCRAYAKLAERSTTSTDER